MTPDSDIVISLMRPNAQYVSIGYFQEAETEVDLPYCREHDIPVIRRHVGGGSVLLDSGQLFVHIMLPQAKTALIGLPQSLGDRFAHLAAPTIDAYKKLGVNAEFRPINDIHVNGKKIGGTGVGEIEEGMVFAGSMMFDFNTELMAKILNVPDEKMRDKIAETLGEYMTTLVKELGTEPPLDTVADAIVTSMESAFDLELTPSMPTPEEMDAIADWDRQLASDEWLHHIGLRESTVRDVKISGNARVLHASHKAPGGMIRITVKVIEDRIEQVLISGDFPVTPKSALDELAARFEGTPLDNEDLERSIEEIFSDANFDMAGVTSTDFQALFRQISI